MSVDERGTGPAEPVALPAIGERARRAVWWLSASSAVSAVLRLVSSLIMTRLLAPEVYGIVAVTQSLVFGLSMLSDVGLHHSLTRSDRAHRPDYLHAIWTLQVMRGLWISGIVTASGIGLYLLQQAMPAPLADTAYGHPDLPGVLCLVALSPIFDGLASIKAAMANRTMEVGRLSLLDLGVQTLTIVLGIALARLYPTVWVLVGMGTLGSALHCAGTHLLLTGPTSRWRYDGEVARETWHFGRWILASSGMAFVATQGDRLLLAGLTTPAVLGQFSIARNLAGMPGGLIQRLIGSVGYSSLCEIARERPSELRDAFARVQRKVDLACLGCAGLLAPAGPTIITVLYDDRYLNAGWMVSLMSVTLMMQRYSLVEQLAMALGDSAWLARKQAVSVASLFLGVVLGHMLGGANGVVAGAALSPLAVLPMSMLRMHRTGVLIAAVEARAAAVWLGCAAASGAGCVALQWAAAAAGHPLT